MKNILNIVEYNKATRGIRFLNYIIDLFVLIVINYIITNVFGILYELTSIELFYLYNHGGVFWELFIGNFNSLIYYFLMENYLNGRSVSKYITGTKVISIDGTKPSTQQIFYRSLSRIVPFDALSFLGMNGWHDSWSETRVVNIKNYETERQAKSEIDSLGKKEIA
ncbi:RDD family protein [Chryseobacterium sp. MEBOG06]|uniref:RDD family protein n=1 Tax=unclassified Chryseobacterium TaxID=2593645 RepID=UPI001F311C9E|nr:MULTISPECIES: RDD family protein [unclassified Chryseobacterium]UKB83236.1 RDD family protein [Chryseobacterium sp. MEBOG06]